MTMRIKSGPCPASGEEGQNLQAGGSRLKLACASRSQLIAVGPPKLQARLPSTSRTSSPPIQPNPQHTSSAKPHYRRHVSLSSTRDALDGANPKAHYREVLLGITGKDFTLIAASKAAMRGPTILKATDDKTRQLNKNTLMAYSGEAGDTGRLLRATAPARMAANATLQSNSPNTSKPTLNSTR